MAYADIYGPKDTEVLDFEYGGDIYAIVDHYCMQPKCLCNDTNLQVIKINLRKKTQETFFVLKLHLATCQYEVEEMRCTYEEMASVVNHAIMNNLQMLKALKRRYSEMKTAGREIIKKYGQRVKPQVNTVAIGRNDPCPCGSGKKYKNCCQK